MGSADVTLDAEARLVVSCRAMDAGGGQRRQLEQASTRGLPTAWASMPPPPNGEVLRLDLGPDGHGLAWEEVGTSVGPAPLYATADGGASWTPRPDVADGEKLIAEDASAFTGGGSAILAIDQARSEVVLLLSPDGRAWSDVAAFPG